MFSVTLNMRAVDYIIVGQGLAGSCLALELLKRKKKLLIIDLPTANSASRIAAGIFNPITGRTNQPTWLAQEIFKTLFEFYSSAERILETNFLRYFPIYRPFLSPDENGKWPIEAGNWIKEIFTQSQFESVRDVFGGIIIRDSGFLETNNFLQSARNHFLMHFDFLQEQLEFDRLVADSTITYKDYTATKIIFCDGCLANSNPWFNWLPIRKLKGELLLINGNLPADTIVNRGIFSLPQGDNEFVLGSTYVHDESEGVTRNGKEDILMRSKKLFINEFKILNHTWGHRPTTIDRRPILGHHPQSQNICIFNGLGTKGVSLAPFFAVQLADWLEGSTVLLKEVNIERFYSLFLKSEIS